MKITKREVSDTLVDFYKSRGLSREESMIIASRLNESNKESAFFNLATLATITEIKDIDKGASIIAAALVNGETIAAITDYDSDGCHSAAVIYRVFKEMGYEDQLLILTPDRMSDGYGANPRLVNVAHEAGATVIVTADNGISAFAAVDRANELDIKVVVTDHHLTSELGLPNAAAVIDPAREDCNWQDGICCGATVAFFVMVRVKELLIENHDIHKSFDVMRMFQLVGAATIADCVPMIGINRSLVIQGLKMLDEQPYAGYKALLEAYDVKRIDEQVIGFKVAPAINSAGRLGPAAPSISFLATDDGTEAGQFAEKLIKSNNKRKEIQGEVVARVMAELETRLVFEGDEPFLVFGDLSWHHGVVGIVSSRVSDKTMKPSIVFGGQETKPAIKAIEATDDTEAVPASESEYIMKGSGRSGESGLHMKDCFDKIAFKHPDMFLGYGGHAAAAGCSIRVKDFDRFREACKEIGEGMISELKSVEVLVDGIIEFDDFGDFTENSIYQCLMAAPFGQKFPVPEFAIKNVPVLLIKPLGKDKKHIRTVIGNVKTVGFDCATEIKSTSAFVTLIVAPTYNFYRGNYTRQFIIQRVVA